MADFRLLNNSTMRPWLILLLLLLPPSFTNQINAVSGCSLFQRLSGSCPTVKGDCAGNGQFVCDNGHCVYHDSSQQSFDCKCDPGWIGDWCQTACGRNCSNGGQCELRQRNGTEEEVCVCPYPWIGSDCSQSPPEADWLSSTNPTNAVSGCSLSQLSSGSCPTAGPIGIVSITNQTNAGGLGSIGIVSSPNQTNAGGLGSIGIVSSLNQTNAGPGCSLFQLLSGSCPPTGPKNEDRCNNTMCAQLQTDVCYNGGTCHEVDAQNCSCTCPPGFTDPQLYDWQCQRVTSEPDNTTSPTIALPLDNLVTDCAGNGTFICHNGHCVYPDNSQQSFDCKCDPGWIGKLCKTACSRNCSNGGQCELRQRNGMEEELRVCPYPWIGSDCSQSPPEDLPSH